MRRDERPELLPEPVVGALQEDERLVLGQPGEVEAQHARHHVADLLGREGLRDVLARPELDGRDDHGGGRPGGDEDHRRQDPLTAHDPQKARAVQHGHVDVEEDEVDRGGLEERQRLGTVLGVPDLEAPGLQARLEHAPHATAVVDQKNAPHPTKGYQQGRAWYMLRRAGGVGRTVLGGAGSSGTPEDEPGLRRLLGMSVLARTSRGMERFDVEC